MKPEKLDAEGGVRTMHTQNRTTPRKRALLVMACAVAGLVILAGAASAGAAISFIWKVNKVALKDGSKVNLKYINAIGKVTFEDPRFTVVCNGLEAKNPSISEDKRGLHEETLEFKECNVTSPVKGCKVKGEVINPGLSGGEIVEGVGASNGKVLLAFDPNRPFLAFTIEKVGAEACAPTAGMASKDFKYDGGLLVQALNASEEVIAQKFKFDFAEAHNFTRYVGKKASVFLKEGCNILQLKGEVVTELETSEVFGPF
jgi:hypothetical protein